MPLRQQRLDLLGREPVAKLDGRFAGDHVQQLVEQVAGLGLLCRPRAASRPARGAPRPDASWRASPDKLETSTVSPPNGSTSTPSCASSSRCSSTAAASRGGRSTGSGTSSRCDSSGAGEHFVAELLVEDPFVKRMLVDDFEAAVGFGDEVAVVNLQSSQLRGETRTVECVPRLCFVGRIAPRVSHCQIVGTAARSTVVESPQRFAEVWRRRICASDRLAADLLDRAARFAQSDDVRLTPPPASISHSRRRAGSSLRGERAAGHQIGRQELRPQRAQQLAVDPAAVLEATSSFVGCTLTSTARGGMSQLQKTNRVPAREQQPAVRFAQRMLQRPIANERPLRNKYCIRLLAGCASGWRRSHRA